MNTPPKIIVRFALVAEQPNASDQSRADSSGSKSPLAGIKRYTGFVKGSELFPLFDYASLDANPRSAKTGTVVDDIMDSLENSADLFPFKSKGILLGTSDYEVLQRNRFELNFGDPASEGILDGGHNMLAIGLHMLSKILENRELSKVRLWGDMKQLWDEHRAELEDTRSEFSFLVPVELIVPSRIMDEQNIKEFEMSVLDICAARNNNAQLTQETKSNKMGFYNDIRERLDPVLKDRVEWKSNEWESNAARPIKVRDLLSLSWIPLNLANEHQILPIDISVTPQNIYRNKGECSKQFDKLMGNSSVSQAVDGPVHELQNIAVASAFDILSILPKLYDQIYSDFPDAYNSNGYRFGSNNIVKIYDPVKRNAAKDKSGYTATVPTTHYYGRNTSYRYPDGLIMPLVYGLKGLMAVREGRVEWLVDPEIFLRKHLDEIAGAYRLVLEMASFDPQKVAKNPASHEFAVGEFEKAFLKHQVSQGRLGYAK